MSYKNSKSILLKGAAILAVSPIVLSIISKDIANASILRGAQGIRASMSSIRSAASRSTTASGISTKASTNLGVKGSAGISGSTNNINQGTLTGLQNQPKYKPSKSEKVLGGIAIGVGAVSVLGTGIGLGLTEKQYKQSKDTYDNVIDRNYNSFYQERQEYMEDLFGEWGVPLPEQYKNPIAKPEKGKKTSLGFTMGKGE